VLPPAGPFADLRGYAFLFRCSVPTNFTPSEAAFCRVAVGVRFSLRAIVAVAVFSRASVFNMLTSSRLHGRDLFVFLAIGFPSLRRSALISCR
jgi:hypothetical protein